MGCVVVSICFTNGVKGTYANIWRHKVLKLLDVYLPKLEKNLFETNYFTILIHDMDVLGM